MVNSLSSESSSYLKSAANHPVNWYPWSEQAFEKAKKEDKPILLSIGAVWCHWCHVQAHESWENKEIADFINKNFIAIKVDRDERPDIDKTYQTFVQMMTGMGGWPLTVFLTPNKKPFYGGTYFPPTNRMGLPGLRFVLENVLKNYKETKESVEKMSDDIQKNIDLQTRLEKSELDYSNYDKAISSIINSADAFNGGFGSRPKFPMSEVLLLLLDYYHKTSKETVWKFLDLTLRKMASGGFYDHIGGGFHRYSTDEGWRIPHFEKMLVDNAPLLKVYLKAYQVSGDNFFKKISEETLNFLVREMLDSKTNLFYSSQDADTNHVEGEHFIWTKQEIMEVLGEEYGKIFCMYYGILESGNFENSENVLYKAADLEDISEVLGIKKSEVEKILEKSKKALFHQREKRHKPFTDKNTFAGWNCLAVSAFLDAYKILEDEKYLDISKSSLDFVLESLYKNGKLYHMYSNGKASVDGFLDDYIFFAQSLVDIYQITFDKKYLEKAVEIMEKAMELFYDKKEGGFFYTTNKEMSKEKPMLDFSSPSPNSVAASVLIDLYYLTENQEYKTKAENTLKLSTKSDGYELYKATYLQSMKYFFVGPREFVIISKPEDKQVKDFVKIINQKPGKNLIFIGDNKTSKLSVFKDREQIDKNPTVYICTNKTCLPPITDLDKLKGVI